jgi:hypothetical protein
MSKDIRINLDHPYPRAITLVFSDQLNETHRAGLTSLIYLQAAECYWLFGQLVPLKQSQHSHHHHIVHLE